ncbi:MAG: helix-turn-helix domain-containing protein [Gemmatimonadaceae bacterium]|nr:helix-turn-helix domain-containing protein [Gemmatimonadaceae bacterium]
MVAQGNLSLTEIALRVGFSDQAHFSRSFKKHFGETPSERRKDRLGTR